MMINKNTNDKTKTLQRGKTRARVSGKKSVIRINRMWLGGKPECYPLLPYC